MFTSLLCLRTAGPMFLKIGHDSFGEHMGFKRTKARISYTFYWPGLCEDCLRYVQTCVACQMKARVTYRDWYYLNRYQGQIV